MTDTHWPTFLISLVTLLMGYAWGRYAERREQERFNDAWRGR